MECDDDDVFESVSQSQHRNGSQSQGNGQSTLGGYATLVGQYNPHAVGIGVDQGLGLGHGSVEYYDCMKNRLEFQQYIKQHIIHSNHSESRSKFIKSFCTTPSGGDALYLDKLPYLRSILQVEEVRYHGISDYITLSKSVCSGVVDGMDGDGDYLDLGSGLGGSVGRRSRSRRGGRGDKQERCRFAYTLENLLMMSDVHSLEVLLYKHSMRLL